MKAFYLLLLISPWLFACGGRSASPTPVVATQDVSPPPLDADHQSADGQPNVTWRRANMTNFTSYPDPGSEECLKYNGCTWSGMFAALSDKQPESWVKTNNIAAVHSKDFAAYKLKTLRLRKDSREIDVKVYDMCADSDCDGCCTKNSKKTGFLIDIESYTSQRFGTDDGIVEWTCLDCDTGARAE